MYVNGEFFISFSTYARNNYKRIYRHNIKKLRIGKLPYFSNSKWK